VNAQDPASEQEYLLTPDFLRRLEQAAIASRHILAGRTKGERRSAKRGSSVEFADYRSYSPGDDLRYLDWNAYARLQKLFLKLFLEEEDLHVYALVDVSQSMDFGRPTKLEWARQAAAALGYIGLCSGDRVQMLCHAQGRGESSRQFRGQGCAREMFEWLSAREPEGQTDLLEAVQWLVRTIPSPGMIFVISDLMTPGWESAVRRLAGARGEVCVMQVLARDEYQPGMQGDLKLVDSESGDEREITMGSTTMRRYLSARDGFLEDVRGACSRYGFSHLLSVSDEAVEDVILRSLRRLGVVR